MVRKNEIIKDRVNFEFILNYSFFKPGLFNHIAPNTFLKFIFLFIVV